MRWLINMGVKDRSPVVVNAPSSVEVFAHKQAGRSHLVVNLVNSLSGSARTAGSATHHLSSKGYGSPVRFDEWQQMPAIAGISVRFRPEAGRPVSTVLLGSDQQPLPIVRDGDDVVVTLPPLNVHAMLVAEY